MATSSERLALLAAGEMGERMLAFDWSRTPLGPIESWPLSLKTTVGILLNSRYPMFVWWGRERINLYNDAYIPILGKRHPEALGRPARETWSDIWDVVGPQAEAVLNEGRATWNEDLLLLMERHGFVEETYFTFSYSPVLDDGGGVAGLFCACMEDTRRVLGERRLKTLRDLGERSLEAAKTLQQACHAAAVTLAENPHDFPFALIYLLDENGRQARLAEAVQLEAGAPAAPGSVSLGGEDDVWSFHRVLETGQGYVAEDLEERFGRLAAAAWPDDWTRRAVVLPLAKAGSQELPAGFLVAGLSPRLTWSDEYRGFLELAAGQIATAIGNVRVYEKERRRAEALRTSEAKFSTAFGRSPLALTITSVEDGRLVEVNESFERLSGYTREEAVGRKPEELGLWIDPEERAERFARLLAGERLPNAEARFRIKSGEELIGVIGSAVVEIDGRPCVLSSVLDITERKQADERLRLALAGARAGVWQWNLVTQEVIWSPELYDLLRLPEGKVTPSFGAFAQLIHPDDREQIQARFAEAMARGGPFELEIRVTRGDGTEMWLSSVGRVEQNAEGTPVLAMGINQDITERKRALIEQARAVEALREADRRKDEFLAMLAHELRNPLAPIRNAVHLLKLSGPLADRQQWAREVIERQTQQLTRLVDDLLDVSRITRGKVVLAREPLDLSTIVSRAVETSRPLIDARRHHLEIALPPEPVRLEGDLTRLVQVVGNLLNNAAKYTDEGGSIRLEAALEDGKALIRVRDDGMGLSSDLLPHVFDLFSQADRSLDRSQGGLGIGLTLVRRLVEMHDGEVEARSDGPGRGSEFIVRLPAEGG